MKKRYSDTTVRLFETPNTKIMRPPHSLFNDHFQKLNPFVKTLDIWKIEQGMSFKSPLKWWGNKGTRKTLHEGIDLCSLYDIAGCRKLNSSYRFTPLFSGTVVGLFADFLGKSILFRHNIMDANGRQLYSVFGHVFPLPGIVSGAFVTESQPVVRLAESPKADILPDHLHISLMWILPLYEAEALNWDSIASSKNIFLVDPLEVLYTS